MGNQRCKTLCKGQGYFPMRINNLYEFCAQRIALSHHNSWMLRICERKAFAAGPYALPLKG